MWVVVCVAYKKLDYETPFKESRAVIIQYQKKKCVSVSIAVYITLLYRTAVKVTV
jgi:hypothetical protein